MEPTISADLKLVFPVRVRTIEKPDPDNAGKFIIENEPVIWAYHIPIGRAIFEANYRVLAQTKYDLRFDSNMRYTMSSALRIATLTLLDAAKRDAAERGTEDSGPALLAELANLTTILVPSADGFDFVPVEQAVKREIIDAEEWTEVQSYLVFFTSVYAMALRDQRASLGSRLAAIASGSLTSLTLTDFVASLRTSTPVEISEPPPTSSVPS